MLGGPYKAAARMICFLNTTLLLLPTNDQRGHHQREAKALDKGSHGLWVHHTPICSLVWGPSSSCPLETHYALISVPSLSIFSPILPVSGWSPTASALATAQDCLPPSLLPFPQTMARVKGRAALPSRIKLIGKKQAHPSSLLL